MTLVVVDASALVALLVDDGPGGAWVSDRLRGTQPLAPALVAWEVANVLRRHELAGIIPPELSALAHHDFLALSIGLVPYEPLATRVWAHRENLSAYDASYVALAETTGAPLVTTDGRIARAPGVTCVVELPPSRH